MPVDVVVLAGGAARRFGADKVALLLDTVLDSVADGLRSDLGALVCVGPPRPTRRDVGWTREEPPLGGPLAGVATGLAWTSSEVVGVVGGDMPEVGWALAALVSAVASHDAAVLADADGRVQPLAAAWQRVALARQLAALEPVAGRPLRLLLDDVDVVTVSDRWGAGRDVDVPSDLS